MNFNEIDTFIQTLSELSAFLVRIKHEQLEQSKTRNIEAVKNCLDGFSIPFDDFEERRRSAITVDSQLNDNVVQQSKLFDNKEIEMLLDVPGVSLNKKPRSDGRYQGYITLNGSKHYVYGKTPKDVAIKIQLILNNGIPKSKTKVINGVPITFNAFSQYYFKHFREKKVAEKTLRADLSRYNTHIKPYFKEKPLKKITALECQTLIAGLSEQGKGKTADEVFSLLSLIFKIAIKHDILKHNPLDIIYRDRHERKHGKTLSAETLKEFRKKIKGDEFEPVFMLALYTGLRPNEYFSAKVDGDFIVAVNSKRKNGKVEYKKIPVMKGFRPYVNGNFKPASYEVIRKRFKELLPDYTLKDLRKTFNSRCIECGINDIVRKLWMGHSLGELGASYTELSDRFMQAESSKFYYDGE